jgi:hypothetical protein
MHERCHLESILAREVHASAYSACTKDLQLRVKSKDIIPEQFYKRPPLDNRLVSCKQ